LIETTADGILIRKPEGNHDGGEQGSSSTEQVEAASEALQAPSNWSKMWQSIKSRITKGVKK
jgi:hypothetical protein